MFSISIGQKRQFTGQNLHNEGSDLNGPSVYFIFSDAVTKPLTKELKRLINCDIFTTFNPFEI